MDNDNNLSNHLTEILVADLGNPKLEAKIRIKHFYGMLKVSDKKHVQKLSEDFQKAGLENFIINENELRALPKHERIFDVLEAIRDM